MAIKAINSFLKWESASGVLLFFAAILAIIISNTSMDHFYDWSLNTPFTASAPSYTLLWLINDALMVLFFLVVGLEIKRELVLGQLSSPSRIILPLIAAAGGMATPALIYILCTGNQAELQAGWAIPTATDIAFSLGILSLLGSRVPLSLKLFLTAVAIFDDIGAICIIAFYYSHELNLFYIFSSLFMVFVLCMLNRLNVLKLSPYLICGFILWFLVLKSGIHATIAGVLLAATIPLTTIKHQQISPLHVLERRLHPWVAFAILPLFGFANAGLSFTDVTINTFFSPVLIGIALGLIIGKSLGIFLFSSLLVKVGLAQKPQGSDWISLFGIANICGVGFTMSLFIGNLAFAQGPHFAAVKIGVFLGSVIAGSAGFLILRFFSPDQARV